MLKRFALLITTAGMFLFSPLNASANPGNDGIDQPLSTRMLQQLEAASKAGLQISETPSYNQIQEIEGANPAPKGKTGVLYIGADFCPYCAATRWPLLIALMRFGMVFNVETMRSSPTDVYPSTTTLSFAKTRYLSSLVRFIPIETADRMNKPLQPIKGQAAALFTKFDSPPYARNTGGIPFLYIGGRWLLLGTPVNPEMFGTTDWNKITAELANPKSKLAKAVLPQANLLTAAICETTGNRPKPVCAAPGVTAAATMLPPR